MRYVARHVMWCLAIFVFVCTISQAAERTFHVSPAGNDSWEGTSNRPFANITKARDTIRGLLSRGLDAPVTVIIHGGIYELKEPVVFTTADSGTETCPITYRAAAGEKPVISGGRAITGSWRQDRNGVKVLAIPAARNGAWYFRQLFRDGERQVRARTPNQGYLTIDQTDPELGKTALRFKPGDVEALNNPGDVEFVVFHSWNESRCVVKEIDPAERIVRFNGPVGGWGVGRGGMRNRYFIENSREFIDQPEEWYLDRTAGELYYYPPDKGPGDGLRAPVLNELMRLEGNRETGNYVHHIRFVGLTFQDVDWTLPAEGYPSCGDVGDIVPPAAITFDGADDCSLESCIIANVGTYAIDITGSGNRIVFCDIHDCGSGGIVSRSYRGARNVITDNHIHHCGMVYVSAVGVNIDDGGGEVSHNHIHDIGHSGIYTRHWATSTQQRERRNQEQGLVCEFNHIHDVSKQINDTGGFFVRDSNIVIRNNLIHDVYSFGNGTPGWGVYLGCETRDTLVEKNVVYNTRESVHVWYSNRNNIIRNNIFSNCLLSQINYQNPQDRSHENIVCERNIFYTNVSDADLFHANEKRSAPVTSDYNVMWNDASCILENPVIGGMTGISTFEEWRLAGYDQHALVEDPQFVNSRNGNFTLKSGSPAFKLGFEPIDISAVGPRSR